MDNSIKIKKALSVHETELLAAPFGFKGSYVSRLWQVAVQLETDSGTRAVGLGTQSVLWSDAEVFAAHSEEEANSLMYAVTGQALEMIRGKSFSEPFCLLDEIIEEVSVFGRRITVRPGLRKTFVLNALAALDNAAWLVYARSKEIRSFYEMVPAGYRDALGAVHDRVASVPVVGYGIPVEQVERLVAEGYFILKIKLGSPGTQVEMLERDKLRLEEIHRAVGHRETPYTCQGCILYYLDCNGRYETIETFLQLVRYLEKSGLAAQVLVIEEPFPESCEFEVREIPLRVAADESAHTAAETGKRIELGYGAIALKPAAKTLSETLRILCTAHERGVPCFCADLTVNPVLAEWNRNLAARLSPLPGLEMGLMEANGHQLYADWQRMLSYHPHAGKPWTTAKNGIYYLDREFHATGGGIFEDPEHYVSLFAGPTG